MMGENVRQPQEANYEPCIYALQKKAIRLPTNLDLGNLAAKFQHNQQLQNNIVQTVNTQLNSSTKREDLKRKLIDLEEQKPKNAKVTSDSIAEQGDEMAHREYCINPITVVTNGGELTLVERNKVTTPEKEALVLTPHHHPLSDHDGESMPTMSASSSSSASKKRKRQKRKSRCSTESMNSDNENTDDSSEGSDNVDSNVNVNQEKVVQPLEEEILKRLTFEDVQTYMHHFEHAYQCEKAGGDLQCRLGNNCHAQDAKQYIEGGIEEIRKGSFTSLSKDHQYIIITLFHHSMACQLPSGIHCPVPQCSDFKMAMKEILQNNSSGGCNELMQVVFSNNNYFKFGEDDRRSVQEGEDFKFFIQHKTGKGSFGEVSDCWMGIAEEQVRIAVKKSGKEFSKSKIELPVEAFIHLGKAPYLLFPDVILRSHSESLTYMIMEKAEMSLKAFINEHYSVHCNSCNKTIHYESCNPGLSPQLCSLYFYQMAQGLKYLHGQGYTHGDIKPENVVVMPQFLEVKLIDFDSLKKEEVVKRTGTHGYIAPEIFDPEVRNVLKSSDVYSLCCCLPEMLLAFKMYNTSLGEDGCESRSQALIPVIARLDENLAIIFQCGVQRNHKVRPTIDKIIECFKRNAVMRERKSNVNVEEIILNVEKDKDKGKTLSRKVLDYWIDDIMNSLRRTLIDVGDNMDILEDERNIEDVSLTDILQNEIFV